MMAVDLSTFKKVPVIGLQPKHVTSHGTIVSTVVLCDCGSQTPILVPNLDRAGVCMTCKTKYVISKIEMQNVNGQVSLNTQIAKWTGPVSASPDLDLPA